jgi:hypothetical protein
MIATVALALALACAAGGCWNGNDSINNSVVGMMRFQALVTPMETLLIDGATGDVWRLDETSAGELDAAWARYAAGPADARQLDLNELLSREKDEATPAK